MEIKVEGLEELKDLIKTFSFSKRQIEKEARIAFKDMVRSIKKDARMNLASDLRLKSGIIKNRLFSRSRIKKKGDVNLYSSVVSFVTYEIPLVVTGKPSQKHGVVRVAGRSRRGFYKYIKSHRRRARTMILSEKKDGRGLFEQRLSVSREAHISMHEIGEIAQERFVRKLSSRLKRILKD